MESKQEELRARTKRFALRIIRLFRSLPRNPEAGIVKQELLADLLAEANELVAIFAASYRTARH